MNLNLVIELCAEDRARLDNILAALEKKKCNECVESAAVVFAGCVAAEQQNKTEPATIPAEAEKPAEVEKQAPAPIPEPAPAPVAVIDRRAVKSLAVRKIQDGHRDDVKALIQAYGAEKLDQVPEDRLADFAAELEKIGG